MSTDHQRYSTENQGQALTDYAAGNNIAIVRIYADEGKSGLTVEGRAGLRQLLSDIEEGSPGYEALLVYDVSRWGRFQDADESAYYEYICRRGGVRVIYCAEQFENDGSPVSTIVKSVKRAMAGEYSRELSSKVFIGQCRLVELGFRQGGAPGFGLRRALLNEAGEVKATLKRGEQKSLQTDRVILVPGPADEVRLVRRMFSMFTRAGLTERAIAEVLNAEGHTTDLGRPWTRGTVHQVLTNEKYIGNNLFNRVSFKLKKARVRNPPDRWVRAEGAFEAIVDREGFERVQAIIAARSQRMSDDELLAALSALLGRTGALSGLIIDEQEDLPSASVYRSRFGSLIRAYSLVGYRPARDYRYLAINRRLRQLFPDVITTLMAGFDAVGCGASIDPLTDLIDLNDELQLAVVIARCQQTQGGSYRWQLRFEAGHHPDLTLAVRMDAANDRMLDCYLFPRMDLEAGGLRLKEDNGLGIEAYRFDDFSALFDLVARQPLREAA